MLSRLAATSLVFVCASLALAQPDTTDKKQPKKDTPPKTVQPPAKKPEPAKDDKKAAPTLKVGSQAPAITAEKWVKGKAVTSFEKGKVYVVEFWATWCGPCKESIPHLSELQKKHPELTVVGVAASEKMQPDGSDKRLATVETFVKDQGDKMGYTVAYDANEKMWNAWMAAAGHNGIPCAFIIGADGKIAWIGNPTELSFNDQVDKALRATKKDDKKKDEKPADKTKKKDDGKK